MAIPVELPEHGDIVESDIDSKGRLYIELWDTDLGIARRFFEDKRMTAKRENQREVSIRN
jgi:hypothetical protein